VLGSAFNITLVRLQRQASTILAPATSRCYRGACFLVPRRRGGGMSELSPEWSPESPKTSAADVQGGNQEALRKAILEARAQRAARLEEESEDQWAIPPGQPPPPPRKPRAKDQGPLAIQAPDGNIYLVQDDDGEPEARGQTEVSEASEP